MAVLLWFAAVALLALSFLLDQAAGSVLVKTGAALIGWVGVLVTLVALAYSLRRPILAQAERCQQRLGRQITTRLQDLAAPALVASMPPQAVLSTLFTRLYGPGRNYDDVALAILGGPGRDPSGGDSVVSRETSVRLRIEAVGDDDCVTYLTCTHRYSGVSNDHRMVIFATSEPDVAKRVSSARIYPIYELWTVAEEDLDGFDASLREHLTVGITYRDSSGELHRVEPARREAAEVHYPFYDSYISLTAQSDKDNLRIFEVDLYEMVADDHVVDSIETLTVQTSNVASLDLGYIVWWSPHPCFVRSVTFDVKDLPRHGERLTYRVLLSTVGGATLLKDPSDRADSIVVPVDSWMLPGHNVTLLYREASETEPRHAP